MRKGEVPNLVSKDCVKMGTSLEKRNHLEKKPVPFNHSLTIPSFQIDNQTANGEETPKMKTLSRTEMNLMKFKINSARADENKKKVALNYDNNSSKTEKAKEEEKMSIKDVLSSPESRSVLSRFPSKSDDKSLPYRRILSSRADTLKTKADLNTLDTARQSDKLPNWMSKVLEEKNKHFSHRPSLTLSGNTISTNINGSLTGNNTQFKTVEALKLLRNKTNNNIYNNASLTNPESNITNIDKEKSRNFLPDISAGKYHTTDPMQNPSVEQNEKYVLDYIKKANKSNQKSNTTNFNDNADFQNFNISDLQSLKDLKYFINKNNSNGQKDNNPIMNIVNNVNPKKTDKKVEINFNQYEIKIVPEKKKSSNEEESGNSSQSNLVEKDPEKESTQSKGEANLKKNIIKKLSMKPEKPIGSPTKIVINRAHSKKIILKINNKDDMMDNLNINVSNSPKDSISISLKTNKENESASGREKNSDSSTEAIKKNKKVFLQRLIEIPEKDDSRIDNSKMTDPIKQLDVPKDLKGSNIENNPRPVQEENNELNDESRDIVSKDELKMNKLLKPFNKNFIRQLSRISEISNIISKGYDSNTGNSFDSNPLMKMKNKVKEVKENLNKFNVEEIELRKNLQVVNHTISDKLSSDQDSVSIQKEKENSEKLIINNEEDNKVVSLECIKTDPAESDKSRVPINGEGVHKTQSFEANESESEALRTKKLEETVKEISPRHNDSRHLSSNSSSKSSKKITVKHSPSMVMERKPNTIKSLLNTPSIKLMINKPKKGVRFSMINTILGENPTEEQVKKPEESFEFQRRKTEAFLPLSDQKSEKWVLDEMSQIYINKKCEAELYKIYKTRKLKNLYKKFKYGIMNLYLKNQIVTGEKEDDQKAWEIDHSLFPVNVKSNQAELLLSNYFNDSKLQSISLDYYLSQDFQPVKNDRINLFENFDIYSTKEFENTFKQLMSKSKGKEKEKVGVTKKYTFKESLKKTFYSVIKNDIPSLSLYNVIYFNKYLQLDLPENGMLEYADDQKKGKLIEQKMRSNDNIQSLLKNEILTPKLTAAVKRMSSLRLYDGTLVHNPKKEEDNNLNKSSKTSSALSNKSKESVNHSSDEDSEIEEQELKDVFNDELPNLTKKEMKNKPDKRKLVQKNSNSLKMQIKKPSDNEYIQNYLPQKFSILKNENFFEINDKMNTMIPNENWGHNLQRMINKRKLSLFTSITNIMGKKPFSRQEDDDEPVNKSHKMMNKESMLFRTNQIKSNILKMNEHDPKQALFFYIKDEHFQNFKEIMEKKKFSPEERDEDGNTFLNLAVQCNSLTIVDYLINLGADVNTQNNKLNTPLHYALSHKNFKIADMLIKRHADESVKNMTGVTPWQCITNIKSIV